ncbi:MAG: 30S ribosomal protein S6 [Bdellovibrionales bacterium]
MSLPVRPYEAVVILSENASLEAQKELFRKNKGIIEDYKGEVSSLETWGKRPLGNPIKKQRQAFYFHTTFNANTEAVAELERTMKINEDVLRVAHFRLDDRTDLTQYMTEFKENIAEALKRDKEKELKAQKRAQARKR